MQMHDKPIVVAAGIIRKGNKVLITQRLSDSHLSANQWEFPGGKIRYLEHPEQCLVREIREENGFEIRVDTLFTVESYIYKKDDEKFHVILIVFLCDWVAGEPQAIECQDIRWVEVDEMRDYEFSEADIPIVEQLHQRI
jgi:mutator protein MutT